MEYPIQTIKRINTVCFSARLFCFLQQSTCVSRARLLASHLALGKNTERERGIDGTIEILAFIRALLLTLTSPSLSQGCMPSLLPVIDFPIVRHLTGDDLVFIIS